MKSFLKVVSSTVVDGVDSVLEFSKQVGEGFNHYFASDDYEADLDEVIAFLYIMKPLQARNFDVIRNRQLRVGMKMKFIFSQSRLLLGASAAIGAEVGLVMAGPQGAVTGATIGTATGVLAITFVAGRILIRRLSDADQFAKIQ